MREGGTPLHWLTAPAFASMTGGPNRLLALLSCSQRQVQLRHRSSVRKGEGVVVIKLLGLVRVDATHQSIALYISLFTHFKWTTSYVDIFCFVCSHLLQSLKRLIFGNGGSTTHACMPWLSFRYLHVLIWCTLPNFDYKFNKPNFHACHKKLRGCLDCDYVCLMLPHYFSHTCHTCLTFFLTERL